MTLRYQVVAYLPERRFAANPDRWPTGDATPYRRKQSAAWPDIDTDKQGVGDPRGRTRGDERGS